MTYRCLAEHKVYQRGSSTNGGRLLVTSEASIRERSYTIFVPVFSTNLSLQIRQLHPTALGYMLPVIRGLETGMLMCAPTARITSGWKSHPDNCR